MNVQAASLGNSGTLPLEKKNRFTESKQPVEIKLVDKIERVTEEGRRRKRNQKCSFFNLIYRGIS